MSYQYGGVALSQICRTLVSSGLAGLNEPPNGNVVYHLPTGGWAIFLPSTRLNAAGIRARGFAVGLLPRGRPKEIYKRIIDCLCMIIFPDP